MNRRVEEGRGRGLYKGGFKGRKRDVGEGKNQVFPGKSEWPLKTIKCTDNKKIKVII